MSTFGLTRAELFPKLRGHDTAVQDIYGILHLDYKVPRKRFLDNVCMQAADNLPVYIL